ncbi:MarR family transcriptional regulator [Streptomyces wedmorensis]|uniref:MarR family transcriptional regulator n=1 Tax=Streptomyces wedmorensis TaxID=43759 RepID=A0ABW6JAB2_STRWE
MAESDEHKFLSTQTVNLLEGMSKTGLYGFKETDRKKFDFTCDLVRDWSRLISGQTLWKHTEGIDKDLRILLADGESKVTLYVARDTVQNRRTVHEIVSDAKNTPMRDRLHRLRTIWIPQDFDADKEFDRDTVTNVLKERLAKDLLIAIILGGVASKDFDAVGAQGGIPGLNLAVIESIAKDGFFNMPDLAKRLGVSASTVRGRVQVLAASGLLDQPNPLASRYQTSIKGKVILDICRSLVLATQPDHGVTGEFLYILELLGLNYVENISGDLLNEWPSGPYATPSPEDLFKGLVVQSISATEQFGIDWSETYFETEENVNVPAP